MQIDESKIMKEIVKVKFTEEELQDIVEDILGTVDYDTYKDDLEEREILGEIESLVSKWVEQLEVVYTVTVSGSPDRR